MLASSKLIETVILIEVFLVLGILFMTFGLKLYLMIKDNANRSTLSNIESYLIDICNNNVALDDSRFLSKWNRIDLLLMAIQNLNERLDTDAWERIRSQLEKSVLLPLARKKARSYRMFNRLLAVKTFSLCMEKEDEISICILLEDKVPIIQLYAIMAAINFGTEVLVNAVLDRLAVSRRLGKSIYLKLLQKSNPEFHEYIARRMQIETNPYVLVACYKMLMLLPKAPLNVDIVPHMHSDFLELKLAALRYCSYVHDEQAISLIVPFLSDKSWEVRAVCCNLLANLVAIDMIPELMKLLSDPVWMVRLNAANAIKSFGAQGIKILEKLNPNDDLYAYDMASYALNDRSFF